MNFVSWSIKFYPTDLSLGRNNYEFLVISLPFIFNSWDDFYDNSCHFNGTSAIKELDDNLHKDKRSDDVFRLNILENTDAQNNGPHHEANSINLWDKHRIYKY